MPLINPDMSEAMDFEPVEAGTYPVKVIDVKGPKWPRGASDANPVKENGNRAHQYLELYYEIINTPGMNNKRVGPQYLSISGAGAGFLKEALKVLLPNLTEGEAFDTDMLLGQVATLRLGEEARMTRDTDGALIASPDGSKRNTIEQLMPLA